MASRQHIKASLEESASKPTVEQAPNCLETPWHYVTIGYNGHQLGLLVDTDDEEEARREAQDLCAALDRMARVLSVKKVVLQ